MPSCLSARLCASFMKNWIYLGIDYGSEVADYNVAENMMEKDDDEMRDAKADDVENVYGWRKMDRKLEFQRTICGQRWSI